MSNWVIGVLCVFSVVAVAIGMIGTGTDGQVRACLEKNSREFIGGQDHVYLTEVLDVKVWRSYPNGTATRFVKYRVQGSNEIKTATCLW